MRTEAPLLAPIFRSDGQARLLSVVLLSSTELSIVDISSRAGLAYATAHREIARLLAAGILIERQVGRTRLIAANPGSPLVPPLREIVAVATGPVVLLAQELGQIDGVDLAFLYGSFAARLSGVEGPAPNDIDLMVVGAPDPAKVYAICDRVEVEVGRPINPTILSRDEFARGSGFLTQIAANPVVAVVGEPVWP